MYGQALDIMTDAVKPNDRRLAYVYLGLADVLVQRGLVEEAERLLLAYIGMFTSGEPVREALSASTLGLLGEIHTKREEFKTAEGHLLEAYCIADAIAGPQRAGTLASQHRSLVKLYEAWGRSEQAEAYRTEANADSALEADAPD